MECNCFHSRYPPKICPLYARLMTSCPVCWCFQRGRTFTTMPWSRTEDLYCKVRLLFTRHTLVFRIFYVIDQGKQSICIFRSNDTRYLCFVDKLMFGIERAVPNPTVSRVRVCSGRAFTAKWGDCVHQTVTPHTNVNGHTFTVMVSPPYGILRASRQELLLLCRGSSRRGSV